MSEKESLSAQAREDADNARLFGGGQSRPKKTSPDKHGMSDAEIIASGAGLEPSKRVPRWFIAIVVVMVLIAYGLTLPFWGDRVDAPRPWFTWGHVAAFAYIVVFGGFVYAMTMLYDPKDSDEGESGDDKK